MSNAIQFLEALGRSPATSCLDMTDYAEALASAEFDDAQRHALIRRDAEALSKLLDGRPWTLCLVATPDGGETQDEPDKSDEDGEEPGEAEEASARIERPN